MRWLRVLGIWALAGCYRPANYTGTTFQCVVNADCLQGQVCRDGLCALLVDAALTGDVADAPIDAPIQCMPCPAGDEPPETMTNLPVIVGNDACDVMNTAAADGLVAGLPNRSFGYLQLDTQAVSSCLAVGFAAAIGPCDRVRVTAARGDACGDMCQMGGQNYCDRPTELLLYGSPTSDRGDFRTIQQIAIDATFRTTQVDIALPAGTKFIAACRPGDGPSASDVLVDAIRVCRGSPL